ncbi:DUF2510 domain-containing protein [Leifsonia sp. LS-T14]|uniref:DUF2510 domain-containing protein n=1 Tax=unclassified Leifsonia TaxID=2663824 RepID=UPI0035A5DFA2
MTAVPGWYDDPNARGMARYWDGAAWTQHVHPLPTQAAAPAAAPGYPSSPYAPYPTHQPGYTAYGPMVPVKNSRATRALVWGIISIVINPFALPSILAIVFGAQGRKEAEQLEAAGYQDSGRARATAGLVVGIVGAALFVVWMLFYFARR